MSHPDCGAPVLNWTPPPKPTRTALEGQYVRLEPLRPEHAKDLFHAFKGADEIWKYMAVGPFKSEAGYAGWISDHTVGHDPLFFALYDLRVQTPQGVASFLRIKPNGGSIELGNIALSPVLQKSIAATEAWYLMMEWAFSAGYRRFEWKCNALNLASRRAAQRLGLSFEGIFRQATVVKGCNRDTAWFAAIDSEWPQLDAAFQRWLNPGNFDQDGTQRTSLSDLTKSVLVSQDPMTI